MDNSEEKKCKLPDIEGYQIERRLGQTTSTVSFKALSERYRTNVQITVSTGEAYRTTLKPYLDESFPKITKTLKLVEHPNVIPLLDAGYTQEMPFTVTPFYAAGSLKQHLGTARNWRDVFSILLPTADALAYCHDHEIIHRDVRPQNIVINDRGDRCLTNFSLLKPAVVNRLSVTLTGSGECYPAYIAPEVWQGKFSPAIDQYSFGVMLYELLTATLPFDASNFVSLLVQQAAETVAPPSALVGDVPKVVDAMVEKILSSDPNMRFASMRDLRNVMQELLSIPSSAYNSSQSEKMPVRSQKIKPAPKLDYKPALPSENPQPEQPTREIIDPSQGNVVKEKKPGDRRPDKKSNALIFVMFSVLAMVILCLILFLVGLIRNVGIITQLVDKMSVWIEWVPLNPVADEARIVPTATLIASSPTAVQMVPDFHYSLVVNGIGGATTTQYYESSSSKYPPKFWTPTMTQTQPGSNGMVFDLPIAMETTDPLGVKLQVLRNDDDVGDIHVFGSSQAEIWEDQGIRIELSNGMIFAATAGLPVYITSPLLPTESVVLTYGQILVEAGRIDIKVWCLKGKCEIMRDGEWINTIIPLTRSSYFSDGGLAEIDSNTQILFGLVDELKEYNLECNSCMDVEALYSPK